MKNTKEITTGAMLLAIYGAVLLIDRQLSFLLTEILVLAAPVLIIVFGNMYNFKDGIIFSIALLIISMIVSPSVYSYFYLILGSIIGNIYNFLLQKGVNSKILLLVTIGLFIVADISYMFIVSPLLLNQTFEQELIFIKETMNEILPPEMISSVSGFGISFDDLLKTIGLASFVLMGLMEGLMVHLVSIVILKRFKIQISASVNQLLLLKPVAAYILFICSALIFAVPYIKNSMAASICIGISSVCLLILCYYGYVYCLMFLRVRYKKNYSLLLILAILFLLPFSLYILFFIGFLYGAGPLKKYLVVERSNNE